MLGALLQTLFQSMSLLQRFEKGPWARSARHLQLLGAGVVFFSWMWGKYLTMAMDIGLRNINQKRQKPAGFFITFSG